jgi:hypothetical protein
MHSAGRYTSRKTHHEDRKYQLSGSRADVRPFPLASWTLPRDCWPFVPDPWPLLPECAQSGPAGNIAGKLSDLSTQRIQFNRHYVELAGQWGGRRFSELDGENKRECRILDLILGGPFPGRRRRFREPVAQHIAKKAPGPAPGAHAQTAGFSLPADLEAGSTTRGAAAAVTAGDHLDPEGILVLEVGGLAGLAQRIQAALLRT